MMNEQGKGTPMNMDRKAQSAEALDIERQKIVKLLAEIILQNVRRRYLETDFGVWGYKRPSRRK
ncbi:MULTISPECIES: hypothetical protein [unclassified Sphingobacterium]|uniref:hypothetical protein n=1 Tax=unclassified Sphingobacterium TaxID=2609468 RepID=UPI0028ABBE08|nr:hypothetical protein [Sphingobacterium sp.]